MYRILVIDDDEAIRRSFELALEDAPYWLTTVPSGEDGLAVLNEANIDLIFMDLNMPTMDGVETLVRLREAGFEAPVYIVTAFADEFMARLRVAAEKGLDFELMHKPLSAAQIRSSVEAALPADSTVEVPSIAGAEHGGNQCSH